MLASLCTVTSKKSDMLTESLVGDPQGVVVLFGTLHGDLQPHTIKKIKEARES